MTATVCTPLRTEWLALAGLRGDRLPHAEVVRTGRSAGEARPGPTLVAGVAGALVDGLGPGDLVVASEVRAGERVLPTPASVLLAGELRREGLPVHQGPLVSTDHVVESAAERAALAATGAIAVDTESGLLVSDDGTSVVLRAIVDGPQHRLLSMGTPARGVTALAALRRAAPIIDRWAAATGERDLLLAGPRSFCAGVERAIEIVERALDQFGGPVYVRRQIVHNRHVVADLEARGAIFVGEVDEVPPGSVVVLAAHGVAPDVRRDAERRRLQVIDATCPLVSKVHQEVRRFTAHDNTVLLIGHHDHEEVVGTRGEAPDNVIVVADPEEAARVQVPDPERVAYVMQTTLAVDEAAETAAVLRARFPVLAAPHKDDICYATTNRQQAVRKVARESDLVLVLGSQNSSNSQRLAEVSEAEGTRARLVDDAGDVELGWLDGVRRVGITAGASAPPALVQQLVTALSGLGPTSVHEVGSLTEDVQFALPKEVTPA
ncbi:4-hydroxy-3-methylbut-2-enyl diphosphate reductase [Nocardioides terrisoli]|uniref:4-hydroxy-3-methylbut-2-enyl diphosphate reductase n=1 Tax=Nocardioides terrisoli TaxID=3388267 RepID=UPI00287B8F32|nr:4-hydroxy-3-methylbut-2-enyl diphosphate reductase [Nocardioides marmorisolisilvae]